MASSLPRSKILIVDDAVEVIDALVIALEGLYDLRVATSGPQALRLLHHDIPDLMLLDVVMPAMGGLELCSKVKSDRFLGRIPIIFMTSSSNPADEAEGLQAGAVDFLGKPVEPALARARIRTHLALHRQQQELERRVEERTTDLLLTQRKIVGRLRSAIEYKQGRAARGLMRVAHDARELARAAGMGLVDPDLLFEATPMHDVGMIGIPDSIINKGGPLEAEEWVVIKKHCEIGASIIGDDDVPLFNCARTVALHHHERWDGSGYPFSLSGNDIPLEARVVAIVDVFDALTSLRAHRKPWAIDSALEYIAASAGSSFDPNLVASFMQIMPAILEHRARKLQPNQ